MAERVARSLVKEMNEKSINVEGSKILIMGVTFKEDCPDIRNTRVIDIIDELMTYNAKVDVYDPWVDISIARKEIQIDMIIDLNEKSYDAIIIAVAHKIFKELGSTNIKALGKRNCIIYDVKGSLPFDDVDARL